MIPELVLAVRELSADAPRTWEKVMQPCEAGIEKLRARGNTKE